MDDAGDRANGYLTWVRSMSRKRGSKPFVMHTLRLERDGGRWRNEDSASRLRYWMSLGELSPSEKPDWVDIELEALEEHGNDLVECVRHLQSEDIQVVVSHHQFQKPYGASEFADLLQKMERYQPNGVKFAATVQTDEDALELLRFAAATAPKWPVSGIFAMGKLGQATRVASPVLGCPLTYGTLNATALAPGQIPIDQLARGISRLHGQFKDVEPWTSDRIVALWKEANLWLDGDRA
jgi:3-dehydroquinate dehydratase type I